jgi:hypothetical protein
MRVCLKTFAEIVGQENVIAGTDCGLGGRVHPQIAWAKLRALRDDREQEAVELNSKVPVRLVSSHAGAPKRQEAARLRERSE